MDINVYLLTSMEAMSLLSATKLYSDFIVSTGHFVSLYNFPVAFSGGKNPASSQPVAWTGTSMKMLGIFLSLQDERMVKEAIKHCHK